MLLQANANPHLKNSIGSNDVMIVSGYGNYEVVELLISKGVDYKYQQEDGGHDFIVACEKGHTQIVELLLKEQVDPNIQSRKGRTALMIASANGHYEVVKLLLEWKADPTIISKSYSPKVCSMQYYTAVSDININITECCKKFLDFRSSKRET